MRVVVVGATGNVGTSVVRALVADDDVDTVVGVVRRRPDVSPEGVTWRTADISTDDLQPLLEGADVLIHLAWLIQPSHDEHRLWEVNVRGTSRLLAAAEAVGVAAVVYASSVGAYTSGPDDATRVDESWPTDGIATSAYSRAKSYTERLLDAFEARNPDARVVRLRPGLIFKAEAASRIHRLFLGLLVPRRVIDPRIVPTVPRVTGVRFQCVHADDVAEAFRLATVQPVRGAFNLAAEPVLSLRDVAQALDARSFPVPRALARVVVAVTWRARMQPIDAGWFDLASRSPLLDSGRARRELGWTPRHGAMEALGELLAGLRRGTDGSTPPLDRNAEPAGRHADGSDGHGT